MQHKVIFIFLLFIGFFRLVSAQDLKPFNVHLTDQGFFGYQLDPRSGELYYFFAEENLEVVKEGFLELDANINQVFSEQGGNKGVILVTWGEGHNFRKELIILDPLGDIETYDLQGLIFPEVTKMVVLDHSFGFLGKMSSGRNFVQLIHVDSHEAKPYILDNGQVVVDIAGYDGNVDVLTANVGPSSFVNVELSTYDEWGNKVNSFKPKLSFMMTSAKLIPHTQARYQIIGTYRKFITEEFGGIYSLQIGHKNQQYFRVFSPLDARKGSKVKIRKINEGVRAGFDIVEILEQDRNLTVVSIAGLKNQANHGGVDLKPVLFHIVRINDDIQELITDSYTRESLRKLYTDPQMFSMDDELYLIDPILSLRENTAQIKNVHNNSFLPNIDTSPLGVKKIDSFKLLSLKNNQILVFGIFSNQIDGGFKNFYFEKRNIKQK